MKRHFENRHACIQGALLDVTGFEWGELISPNRSQDLVRARQAAMYLLLTHTHLNLPQIGALFGGRDHTTVMHARDRVTAAPGKFSDIIEPIERQLGVR